jgi:uncharacterized repeat protein (TIGR01451 family)
VTATPPAGGDISASDRSYYFGVVPGIELRKYTNGVEAGAPPGPSISVGDPVQWSYVVTNTSNIVLTNVVVTDSDPALTVLCPKNVLIPGEVMTCTASGTAQFGQYTNSAVVTVEPELGIMIQSDDVSHYFGTDPTSLPGTEQPADLYEFFLPHLHRR